MTKQPGNAAMGINVNQIPVVLEAGSRPFPTVAALGTDKIGTDGSLKLDVSIHTSVGLCSNEIDPMVHYGRGILTVAVACEPSEEDRNLMEEGTEWGQAQTGATMAPEYAKGANGSDDDADDLPETECAEE